MTTRRRSALHAPVQYLKGVGPRRAEKLARLGVRTGRDLLHHIPHRYEDATTVSAIATLEPGDDASSIGRVVSSGVLPTRSGLRIFRAVLQDDSGLIECAWPGQPWLERTIRRGDVLLVTGPVRFFHGRQIQPREHTVLASGEEEGEGEGRAGRVFPIYRATEGLTHRQIRRLVEENLERLLAETEEILPAGWLRELGLPPLPAALRTLHAPGSLSEVEPARRRLAFEELFFLQLLHARSRERLRRAAPGIQMMAPPRLSGPFLEGLPFRLTAAQRRAWREIEADMEAGTRMYRLLQGDVGSGKTVVAIAALLKAVENGRQAALMAPTELLAEQHLRTLRGHLGPLGVEAELLTGSVAGRERERVLAGARDGSARLLVGTHALIQEGVGFHSLGLVVVDEQHRFGVEQRRLAREAGAAADTLVMSATPIPRSLALTLYGDLDLSVIDESPPGRRPVITGVRGPESREAALEFVRARLREGRQAYAVYPLIEESEAVDARAAARMREALAERFPEFRVGLLHGRLPAAEKEAVMRSFLAGEIDLLVATSVIEVGIDVPNATVMLIEDTERFGLAQLHQLRGRVGRGAEQSWCVAFHSGAETPERLRVFASTTDGFALAREDLRLRGEGNLFGLEQHGAPQLRYADLERDAGLMEEARRLAREVAARDPELSAPALRPFARELAERWTEHEALFGIG